MSIFCILETPNEREPNIFALLTHFPNVNDMQHISYTTTQKIHRISNFIERFVESCLTKSRCWWLWIMQALGSQIKKRKKNFENAKITI